MNKLFKPFFYSNLFYGLCTVALSIESNLQHGISLNSYRFYILIFLSTVLYYGRIYYKSSVVATDERTKWYRANRSSIRKVMTVLTWLIIADIIYMAWLNKEVLLTMSFYYWSLLFIVPALGLMYTFELLPVKKLRKVGWLKPFIIGFVWAGVVTIFPVLFWQIRHPEQTPPGLLLKTIIFFENFIFISTLAIIFDIKDSITDKRHNLNTFPAVYGVNNTVSFIILPGVLLSFLSLVLLSLYVDASLMQFVIQSIPFLILFILTPGLIKERNLLFYLAAIDGLMFLKAVCGIVSITFF